MSFLQKARDVRAGQVKAVSPLEKSLRSRFPALWEYMDAAAFPDGQQRATSTLLLFREEGIWKGCLNDREEGRTLWSTGTSAEEVIASLEASLASGTAEWRRSYQAAGKKGGRQGGK